MQQPANGEHLQLQYIYVTYRRFPETTCASDVIYNNILYSPSAHFHFRNLSTRTV